MVIGVQGLLPLIHLVDGIHPVQLDGHQPVHAVIGEQAAGTHGIDGFHNVAVAVQLILGGIAIAVSHGYNTAIFVVGEGLGVAFGIRFTSDTVQSVIGIGVGVAVPVCQGDTVTIFVISIGFRISEAIGIFHQISNRVIFIGAADAVFVSFRCYTVHRIVFKPAIVAIGVLDGKHPALGIVGVLRHRAVLVDSLYHPAQGIIGIGDLAALFVGQYRLAVQGVIFRGLEIPHRICDLD